MNTKYLFVVLCFALVLNYSSGKVFTRCELARTLRKYDGFRNDIPNWVCLVFSESAGNTAAVGKPNFDGSRDYGLFQINSHWWCGPGKPCGSCQALLSDDITGATRCAWRIYKAQGYSAWYGWQKECKGRPLPSYSTC